MARKTCCKTWLKGFVAKANRDVPPLDYGGSIGG